MADEAVPLNYLPILLFIGVSIAFGAIQLLAGRLVRPHRPYRAKLNPYESGSPLFSDARIQFPMRYYIIAMLFVVGGLWRTGVLGDVPDALLGLTGVSAVTFALVKKLPVARAGVDA